jgi:hypothetical protein
MKKIKLRYKSGNKKRVKKKAVSNAIRERNGRTKLLFQMMGSALGIGIAFPWPNEEV